MLSYEAEQRGDCRKVTTPCGGGERKIRIILTRSVCTEFSWF